MIYGKIWCVVKPSVGVPLFLSAVAIGSFLVHVALLTNTTWVPAFLNGTSAKAAAVESSDKVALAPPTK
ncbi:MAG: light-harvesting protein [Rubrivivax sp.]|jgi:light-harvesting protein B-800-850 alpha chain|nr:light-harvesting protein [Rubrivivax sp.]